jgi:hypothetical protein
MSKLLTFHTIAYDTTLLSSEINNFILFNHNELKGESDRQKSESIITKWLFSKADFREMFFSLLNIPFYTKCGFEIKEPLISNHNSLPGDVDVLLFNDNQINESIAIEVKKVKYFFNQKGNEKVNKIYDIRDGIGQTKGLLEIGFHQVYLVIIIVSDGRNIKWNNYIFRGISGEQFQQVYDFPDRENLNENIGLIFIEIVQPTGLSIDKTGVIGICIDKSSQKQEQSKILTFKIKEYINGRL